MTEKRFRYYETSEDTQIWDSQTNAFYDDFDLDKITECLNTLHDENEQLKQQLKEEQLRTTPIVLNTHISDDDFKRIEAMIVKHFEKR